MGLSKFGEKNPDRPDPEAKNEEAIGVVRKGLCSALKKEEKWFVV